MVVRIFKFGGICLSSHEGRGTAARYCVDSIREQGPGLVLVVSAMGRAGDPYATDTLASLAPGCPQDEADLLMCCGEVISAVVMASELRSAGVPSRALTGWDAGIVTDGPDGDSDIARIDARRVLETLDAGLCPVVAGFQGRSPEGRVSTLGRGGSDTSALALAAALGASEAVLWKSVDSIFTADPSLVPDALRIERISAEDLRQMSWQGARVVHPRAAEIALESGIPVEVRSHSSGELVTRIEPFVIRSGRYITGVAAGPPVCQLTAAGPEGGEPGAFFSRLFGMIAAEGISMDMFSVLGTIAVFTVGTADSEAAGNILTTAGVRFTSRGPCAKVSIVGAGMHGMRGVMARFAKALSDAGISMLQTVDSHATISALVPLEDRDRALAALHSEFVTR